MSALNANPEQRRRDKVRGRQTLNGLDYVRVSSVQSGSTSSEAMLAVYFINPLSVPSPVADWRPLLRVERPGRALTVLAANPFPGVDNLLMLRVAAPGDLARYTLSLRSGATAPPGFDPLLSEVSVVFTADSTREDDCAGSAAPPPISDPGPEIDYLAKDESSFRRLLFDRLSATLPQWQERSPADVGVALVELIAHAADELSYYQDAVATEAYLGTARQRISVRRHARLFDYFMHEGCNARAFVCVEVDGTTSAAVYPAGSLRFVSRAGSSPVLDRSALAAIADAASVRVFESMAAVSLRAAHNQLALHTFSDSRPCLPAGARAATVQYVNGMDLRAGQILIFEEALSPESGRAEEADPRRRHAVRLRSVSARYRDLVEDLEVQDLAWDDADALPFSLCLITEIGGQIVRNVSVARGNVVLCDHGDRRASFALPAPGDQRRYRPELPLSPVTRAAPLAPDAPASRLLPQDPKEALPAVAVLEQSGAQQIPFLLRQDLLHSGPRDRHFTVETHNDGRAVLRFGDGMTGRQPKGELLVSCRIGSGPEGNLPADAIAHLLHDPAAPELSGHVLRVRNPLPAAGGQSPESIAEVRRAVPWAFRTQQRAVTADDYVEAALRYDDVQQATGRWQWTGSAYTMYLTVSRKGGRAVDAAYSAGLLAHLEPLRLIGHALQLEPPLVVPLDIAPTVYVGKEALRSAVYQTLLAVFSNDVRPDGTRGFFHPDNLRLGAAVYLSQVVSAAIAVPGVDWIDASPQTPFNHFQRLGSGLRDELASGKITLRPRELAQLVNDPQRPTAGRIAFDVRGGL